MRLLQVNHEPTRRQTSDDLNGLGPDSSFGLPIDDNIIEVNHYKQVWARLNNSHHCLLKVGRGVFKAEGHLQPLKHPILSNKSSILLRVRRDRNVVEARFQVNG